ncbi:MAG: hypothetical protein AAGI07_14405, partial [Bacteroidota bacterium]
RKSGNSMINLRRLNRKIAVSYLESYEQLSNFSETINNKKYDCLTSTLLYAYFLEKLGYKYTIRETNYHIYILVNLEKKQVLIEPTDPYHGFIWEKKYINKRIATYKASNHSENEGFLSKVNIDREVNLFQLAGLQYYNKAVKLFNMQRFEEAINSLKKSMMVYDCERNRMFMAFSLEVMNGKKTFD